MRVRSQLAIPARRPHSNTDKTITNHTNQREVLLVKFSVDSWIVLYYLSKKPSRERKGRVLGQFGRRYPIQ